MEITGSIQPEPIELKPCSICGRTFRQDTLERHQRICKKTSEKKRKVFDSKKQRALALESTSEAPKSQSTESNSSKNKKSDEKRKSNWREKHEDLIRTIRRSREGDKNSESDKNNNNPSEPKSHVPSDYVQCPGCKRHFNQRAAERHIPWCQEKHEQQQQISKSSASKDAKEKYFARVRYKVPVPGKAKKTKPKTAGSAENPTEVNRYPERDKTSYSSPPSFMDNRNASKRNASNVYRQKREPRNDSRGRESNKSTTPTESLHHIIKFKEKFPNHTNKRGLDLEESFSAEQLQELLRCSRLTDARCPKTVPGVRLLGSRMHNNWTSELNISSLDYSNKLPEVSSSELSNSWMKRLGWHRDMEMSMSSSGSSTSSGSLPPMSRESPSDLHLLMYCHQCHHKFPLVGAKYCCECGARRRGIGTISQTV